MDKLKTMNAFEARQRFGQLLEEVYYKRDRVLIKRGKKPMAVVIPTEEYEAYLRQRRQDFKVFDEIWEKNKAYPAKEVERDVAKAIGEVRKKRAQGRPRH